MVTPAARREAVAHLCKAYEVSERRACAALGTDRSSMRYRSRRPEDARLRARLRELASVRRRFGYHAIGRAIFLKDTSIGLVNPKDDHTIHPVGYLQNNTIDNVIGGRS